MYIFAMLIAKRQRSHLWELVRTGALKIYKCPLVHGIFESVPVCRENKPSYKNVNRRKSEASQEGHYTNIQLYKRPLMSK